jgi:hypothetical protein
MKTNFQRALLGAAFLSVAALAACQKSEVAPPPSPVVVMPVPGPAGASGATGSTGSTGSMGATGAAGEQGATGSGGTTVIVVPTPASGPTN